MQIDGHHTFTYVAARGAGYPHDQAALIAHAAQYVDDATNAGYVCFDNGALYFRIASAHKMLDYRNFEALANHHSWIPFHFLPGNGGEPAGQDPDGSFIQKLICRPDSPVARDMLRACFRSRHEPHFHHRLGIALHIYADTWSHQGFAGVRHDVNDVRDLEAENVADQLHVTDELKSFFVDKALPLGHGPALSLPDRPYLKWQYTNGLGERVVRDNPADFLAAIDQLCRALRAFRAGDESMDLAGYPGLPEADRAVAKTLIETVRGSGDERHRRWLEAIADGAFSFGAATPSYLAKGVGSWKYQALSQDKAEDTGDEVFPYHADFLHSDWKHFHDALQATRFDIVNRILPRYGICAA